MTDRLREELHRIGATAPVAHVDPATWGRARRARARDLALGAAAVIAVLALVGGLAGVLPSRVSTPVADGSQPGVPDHIWGVPERMLSTGGDGLPSSDRVETDPAVGAGAAAWATEYGGLIVVVGAADGAYHLLRPPGYLDGLTVMMASQDGSSPVALSPDGNRLAYGWSERAPDSGDSVVASGIRVADLRTGAIRTIHLLGGRGILPTSIIWSPDGRWLGWAGLVMSQWTSGATRADDQAAGRVAPGSTRSEDVPLPGDSNRALAITDEGTVGLLTTSSLETWDGHRSARVPVEPGRLSSSGSVSPDGRTLAVGVGASGPVDNPADPVVASLVDLASGDLVRRTAAAGNGRISRVLGWVDDAHLVTLVTPLDSGRNSHNVTQRLEVISADRSDLVGEIDPNVPDTISVATDLMTLERPTVERPEPDWPWSTDRIAWTIGLGVAGALALVCGVWWLGRRRTRLM